MVFDDQNNFVGVLSEGDILQAALPDINQILDEGGSVDTAFDIFLSKGKNLADLPITRSMTIRNAHRCQLEMPFDSSILITPSITIFPQQRY